MARCGRAYQMASLFTQKSLESNLFTAFRDLACHCCYLTEDLSVKVGDYGWSLDRFPEHYVIYSNPSPPSPFAMPQKDGWRGAVTAIPLRWCAPESLHVASSKNRKKSGDVLTTTSLSYALAPISKKVVTAEANVWSLAVAVWEVRVGR